MIYYKPVKVTINASGLAKVIFNVVIWHYSLPDSIFSDRGLLFIFKFWSLLCYFFSIKQKLFTAFHPQIDSQTKRQNSTIEAYLWSFIKFKQTNWAKLLAMAEFVYNNAKNANSAHMPFELKYGYHI